MGSFRAAVHDTLKSCQAAFVGVPGPRLEAELSSPIVRHLRAQGYRAFVEVPFNGRIADVIGVKGDEVIAVELKLTDVKTAHRQAVAYQVGCHRTYVAVPLEVALRAMRKHAHAFETSGAGLLAVDAEGGVREVLAARHHEARFLPFLADALRSLAEPAP